jgi:CubicO group peptidase (beta-lactamase class C family)
MVRTVDYPRRRPPRRRLRIVVGIAAGSALLAAALAGARPRASDDGFAPLGSDAWTRRSTSTGLEPARMARFAERAAELPALRTVIVARHGRIEAEHHFRGPSPDTPVNVKSVSKSLLSALVGIAIAEGHLADTAQPVLPYFRRHRQLDDDPRRAAITIGHLLSMQAGLESTSFGRYGRWVASPDWVGYAISRPMVAAPGGARIYSTGNTHLLSAILTDVTGQNTWAYARDRLATPLGISLPRWPTDPHGIYFGGNDMRISPRDLVRFGELYRNEGRLDGEQIVPAEWVRASLVPRARVGGEAYGFGWFISSVNGHRMFYALGYGGQFLFVVPALELTVVVTSDQSGGRGGAQHHQQVRRLLREWIVPAAEIGAARAAE